MAKRKQLKKRVFFTMLSPMSWTDQCQETRGENEATRDRHDSVSEGASVNNNEGPPPKKKETLS